MAYRKIHDDFWTDPDIEELTPEQKFFYLYLITNPNVNQIGLYEFSIRRACFETGYNSDTVSKLLDTFQDMGKIKRSEKTREILVVKFYWHNKSNSPKVKKHVEGLLDQVKDTSLIQYIYGMDTPSQEEVQEEEEVQEKNSINYVQFVDLWNEVNDCNLRITDNKREQIRARLRTYSEDELKKSIRNRANDDWINGEGKKYKTNWDSFWRNDEKPERYLNKQQTNQVFDGGTW